MFQAIPVKKVRESPENAGTPRDSPKTPIIKPVSLSAVKGESTGT